MKGMKLGQVVMDFGAGKGTISELVREKYRRKRLSILRLIPAILKHWEAKIFLLSTI